MEIGLTKTLNIPFDETIEKVTEELKKEGFGILTTIDVRATMKEKLDVDFRRYTILGACNPPAAHKALEIDDRVGILLPCNVVVQEKGKTTEVSIFNPAIMKSFFNNESLQKLSDELKAKVERVLGNL